jgi:hypothetical protein
MRIISLILFLLIAGCSTSLDRKLEEFKKFDSAKYLAIDTSECSEKELEFIEWSLKAKSNIELQCMKTKKES